MAIDVTYQVYTGGRWLSNVTNLTDYAGIYGSPIQVMYAHLSSGSIQYRTHTQGGDWLPWVTDRTDYAGIYGSPIQGMYASLSSGSIQYRVHTINGSWLSWVTDRTDYAGILGTNIDGLQMQVIGLSGYEARYRAYVSGVWLPWVTGLEDYAGIFGQAIEAIQVEIVSGSSGGGGGEVLPPVTGGRKVFIDPGHGGSDPGAIGNGMNEKDVVLEISKKVGNILTQQGVTVEYSRANDTFVSLEGRAQMANNWGASLFVSIHANSVGDTSATGTECYTYPSTDSANKQLSANVARAISSRLGLVNRGHKEADFAVLRLTNMPAILVETAFISNASDADKLRNRKDDFAMSIATEILKYLGESTPPSVNPDDPMYMIEYLTKLAIKYENETVLNPRPYHYNRFVLDYLRHIKYNNNTWNTILGSPGPFIDYVNKQHNLFADSIKPFISGSKLSNINNHQVDLAHLAATLMVYKSLGTVAIAVPDAWGGWAGDLATAMADISRLKMSSHSAKTEQEIADNFVIGSSKYSISRSDIEADIDAYGLVEIVFTNRFNIVLQNYFDTITSEKRKNLFIKDIGLEANATEYEIGYKLREYMTGIKGFNFPVAGKLLLELATYMGKEPTIEVIKAACLGLGRYIIYIL